MNYFYFDNPNDKSKMKFIEENNFVKINCIFPNHKLTSINDFYLFCKNQLQNTKEEDVLFFWYDFMGIIFHFLCKLYNKKRKIVIVNILLKNKKTLKNKLAKFLYKKTLNSKDVFATVTSKEYGENLKKTLSIKKHLFLMHDVYHISLNDNLDQNHKYLFCGGKNGRDWEIIIKIAFELSQFSFHFIMTKEDYDKYKNKIPNNVIVRYNIPENEFLDELKFCTFVVMPLNTDAPAGLITFFQAVENNKMVMTSNTLTTLEYFSDGKGVLCNNNDIENWKTQIELYFNNSKLREPIIKKCKNYLIENCSENSYILELNKIINEIGGC